ncbi:MAG: ribonuclease J [Deltaproteobacteria bacterium]|nr:ribonuclease J [Deltaproteobacteria bacterium]
MDHTESLSDDSSIRLVALGGLGEVGMNCMVIEHRGAIVLVDCGVTFSYRELGIDLVYPDFGYLLSRADKIKALLVTHGHEDHIGAIPYLLRYIDLPIYGPAYAIALIRERLNEVAPPNEPRLFQLMPAERLQIGPFDIEPVQATHSIPNTVCLVFRTAAGTIVHSGDFKIDPNPPDGKILDTKRLAEIGDEGVRLLLSDSTNIDVEGISSGEIDVASALDARIANAKGRVVVCLFGSNIHRLRAVLTAAKKHERLVLLLGRSLRTHHRLAESLGLLADDKPLFVSVEKAMSIPRQRLLVAATGTQGEPRAVLYRLVNKTHERLRLEKGDEVILSSRVIPGNEYAVFELINKLERDGISVWHQSLDRDLHASGHACREEQRKMLELTRPKAFVPIHGTFYHRNHHARLAQEMGINETIVVGNGTVIEFDDRGSRIVETVHTDQVFLQSEHEISKIVLQDRKLLAQVGIVIIVLVVDSSGSVIADPAVLTRGVVHEEQSQELLKAISIKVDQSLLGLEPPIDNDRLRDVACRTARLVLKRELGWKPLVYCVVTKPTLI